MQSNQQAPKLLPNGEIGVNAFNAYQIYTQLASLYTVISQKEFRSITKREWAVILDSIIVDVGTIFDLWQEALNEKDYGLPLLDEKKLAEKIKNLSKRLYQIQAAMGEWFDLVKMPKILWLFENRLEKVMSRFYELDQCCQNRVETLKNEIKKRKESLKKIELKYENEKKLYDKQFAIPIDISGGE